jgi:hypothetical protein
MDNFIKNHYNIIETYEQNDYQEIQMGTEISDPDNIIVINTLKKVDQYGDDLKTTLENSLQNILHVEKNPDDTLTFVTSYHEGISLKDYLKSSKISNDHRKKIAQDYLNIIKKYEPIDNTLKNILVDPKQININNNELVLNELLLIADDSKIPFEKVTQTIGKTLNLILEKDSFIESLLVGSAVYTSIEDILNVFHTNYIDVTDAIEAYDYEDYFSDVESDKKENSTVFVPPIDMASDQEDFEADIINNEDHEPEVIDETTSEVELTSLGFIDEAEDPELEHHEHENRFNNKYILPIAIILLLLFGIIFAQNVLFKEDVPEYTVSFTREKIDGGFRFTANVPDDEEYIYEWRFLSDGEELATFDKASIPIEFKNEGNYTIELRVKNPEGHWSEIYTDEFYYDVETLDEISENENPTNTGETSDTFDDYTIRYQTDNITDDYENKYQGDRSLKFTFDDENQTAKIKLEGILLKDEGNVSFQIKSSTREPIAIKYVGLVGSTEVFEKNSTYVPELENTWVMVAKTFNTSSVDDLELTFSSENTTIWIDQIEIENYK